jgi:hypothetical protein
LALDASLAFVEPDEVLWSFVDFWPCDFVAVTAADLLLSPAALATAASLALALELVFTGSPVFGAEPVTAGVTGDVGAGVAGVGSTTGCEGGGRPVP